MLRRFSKAAASSRMLLEYASRAAVARSSSLSLMPSMSLVLSSVADDAGSAATFCRNAAMLDSTDSTELARSLLRVAFRRALRSRRDSSAATAASPPLLAMPAAASLLPKSLACNLRISSA